MNITTVNYVVCTVQISFKLNFIFCTLQNVSCMPLL